ncbi:MAG: acetylxylan esterase [Sphingomonadaceae bacterium]
MPASANQLAAQVLTTGAKISRDMQALPVHVGGRVAVMPKSRGAAAYAHQWPGTYFEAAFSGDEVVLKFDDKGNEYRLLIDDEPPIAIPPPGQATIRVGQLAPGPHRLRLEKLTENDGARGIFGGFYVAKDAVPQSVAPRARQIEFIGDSSMTGFGVRSGKPQCTTAEAQRTTDTQSAYPVLVAKHFDADYQINAISARGVARNYAGMAPGREIPQVYPYTFFDMTVPYADPAWRPKVIVLKLNADFVGALRPDEKWKDFGEVAVDYGKAYGAFIAELHRRSPSSAFLIWWFDTGRMGDPRARQLIDSAQQTIRDAARTAGAQHLDFLNATGLPLAGNACGHYSPADQRKLADWLIGYLDAHPAIW